MPLVSNFELLAKEEGIIQNLQNNIITILQTRFESVPSELELQINSLENIEKLQQLFRQAININSLNDFQILINY